MSPRAARRAPGKGVVEEEGGHREDRQDRVERVVEIRRPLHEVLEGNLQARESYGEACVSVLQGGGAGPAAGSAEKEMPPWAGLDPRTACGTYSTRWGCWPASHERSWQHSYTMRNSPQNFCTELMGS